VKEAIRCL